MRLLATLGYCSLTAALLVAHRSPAAEYELSIYAATPPVFWIGVGLAFLCALSVAFVSQNSYERIGALVLGGATSVAVVSLPIIRGYTFHGIHDPLSHVGWARALIEGQVTPLDLVYPGIHTVGAFIAGVTGLSLWHTMLLMPVVFAVVFYVFVTVSVGEIVDGKTAAAGAFSAFLLVPIHPIANSIHPHPSSQAILFVPLVVFLLVRFLRATDLERRHRYLSGLGVCLLLSVFAVILYHPQQAINVLLLLGAIAAGQLLAGQLSGRRRETEHGRIYGVLGISVVAFLLWVAQFGAVFQITQGALSGAVQVMLGQSADVGSAVSSTTVSLQAIGGSVPVLFLKMFLVSTVYVLLTVVVVLAGFTGRFDRSNPDTSSLVRYCGVGLVLMTGVFGLYFVGDIGAYYFRQAAFMTMLGTILGAVGIAAAWTAGGRRTRRLLKVGFVVGLVVMLPLSTMVLFNSPYIHRANQHVTDAKVSAYQTTFETTGDDALLAGLRQEPQRYYDAMVGLDDNGQRDATINSSRIRALPSLFQRDWHLVVGRNAYERETIAYREYRYTRTDFETLRYQRGVDRVHTNQDTTLYYIP